MGKSVTILIFLLIVLFSNCNTKGIKDDKDLFDLNNYKLNRVVILDSISGIKDSIFVSEKTVGLDLIKSYYGNGDIRGVSFFFLDVNHGKFSAYYENNRKMVEGDYDFGIKVGVHKYYHESGKNDFDEYYDDKGKFIKRIDYDTINNTKKERSNF